MTDGSERLGGRLALLRPDALDAAQKSVFETITSKMVPWADAAGFRSRTPDGRLIGPFNVVLYSPEIGGSFLGLQAEEGKHTALSERVRQVVILTVGSVWKAPYELYAHSAVARKAGLAAETVAALAHGQPSQELSGEERVAQRFAYELTASRNVGDDLYAAARAAFGEKGVVDMVVLAGCYHTVCSLLNAFDVPAPEETGSTSSGP